MLRIIPRTLFNQLVVGTILVQTVLLGVFISYTIVSQRNNTRERTRQRMGKQLDMLAEVCSKQLAKGDMPGVLDTLGLSHVSPAVDTARLTDLVGKTLAVSDSGRVHGLDTFELAALKDTRQQQMFDVGNGQLEGVTPVLRDGAPVALLWLEPNHAATLNTLNTVVQVSLSYGGFALLANLLPIFLIVRTVTRPLRRLREATHQIIQDPASSGAFPLPVTTKNEAGELTASFNTMVQELEVQRSELLETLALLDSLLEIAPIGFAFFDADLRFVRVNSFLAELFAATAGKHAGQSLAEFFPPSMAKEMETHLAQVFAEGKAVRNVELSGELSNTPGDGRTWLMHFYPVRTKQDPVRWAGVIAVDITERLRAEEALRRTEKLAATGRLAASIAHEINNPLEAVTNLLYLLRTYEPMDATALGFVATAQGELERVSEITQQMLRFHRQSTLPRATNIAEILDSVAKLYHSRMISSHVTLEKRYDETYEVFGFSGEIRQVLANLIGNALEAMPHGGRLCLRVRNSHGRRSDGEWSPGVRISVTDSGTGMSEETLRRVFEAFFTTKSNTGTGLGLWISEEIITKHAGTVRIKSRTGEKSWTSFSVFFPVNGLGHAQAQATVSTSLVGASQPA